jgi:hypothetical protein
MPTEPSEQLPHRVTKPPHFVTRSIEKQASKRLKDERNG